MGRLNLAPILGIGGLGLLVTGGALFQFFALGEFGDVDAVAAVGAALIGLGGLMCLAARTGR
jgi:hypothetical protein